MWIKSMYDEIEPLALNRMTDDSKEAFDNIDPIDDFWDFSIHSDGYYASETRVFEAEQLLTVDDIVDSIINYSDWEKCGRPNIRLLACKSGRYSDGIAARLADILEVKVKAPMLDVYAVPYIDSNDELRYHPVVTDLNPSCLAEYELDYITNKEFQAKLWKIFPEED